MLELWGMWSTLSLPSLPGSLGLGVVAPDRVLLLKSHITIGGNFRYMYLPNSA